MFGTSCKPKELEQCLSDYQGALQRVAQHVGVVWHQLSPEQLATAICSSIDTLSGKAVAKASAPGSETRPLATNIRKIKLSGAVDIVLTQGTEPKMEVFANDAADIQKVLTTVSGDCLTVDSEPMMIVNSGRGVTQVITGNGHTQVAGRGHLQESSIRIGRNFGTVIAAGKVIEQRSGSLALRVEITLPNVSCLRTSGAGNITYHGIEQDELTLDVSAGSIEVSGKVNRLKADVSGAGDIAAYQLAATDGRLRVSGDGIIKATVTESVVARLSGVGKIKVNGNPAQRDIDVSGIGKIKFVNGK